VGAVHQEEQSTIGSHAGPLQNWFTSTIVGSLMNHYPLAYAGLHRRKVPNFMDMLLGRARAWGVDVMTSALSGGTALRKRPGLQWISGSTLHLRDVVGGRSVLVTGASSGIGRAVAMKVAGAGATALLVARSDERLRSVEREIHQGGGRARAYSADLSSHASAHALLERLEGDGVAVDVLINSAGRSIRRAVDQSYDRLHDFERTMAINYFGSLRLILALLPKMRARREGHVVNVSTSGVQAGTPRFAAYIASKAALDAFTRIVGTEAREDGVRFSTVHMPLVRTPMIEPTRAFRHAPALTPEQAADLVLRPLLTHEKELGTRLGYFLQLLHVLAPDLSEQMASAGHRAAGEW
jgi:NAD(P)-dependent dehydrogenase (short-subunit alcohol dehydrogenase family)